MSRELTVEFGQAFTLRSLYRAIQFCQGFTDKEIVSTLSTQLSWSHFIELLPINDPSARDFYAEMCRIERWDVRTLRLKIGGMLFQRTALSRRPKAVISAEITKLRAGQMTQDVLFRRTGIQHRPQALVYEFAGFIDANEMNAVRVRQTLDTIKTGRAITIIQQRYPTGQKCQYSDYDRKYNNQRSGHERMLSRHSPRYLWIVYCFRRNSKLGKVWPE